MKLAILLFFLFSLSLYAKPYKPGTKIRVTSAVAMRSAADIKSAKVKCELNAFEAYKNGMLLKHWSCSDHDRCQKKTSYAPKGAVLEVVTASKKQKVKRWKNHWYQVKPIERLRFNTKKVKHVLIKCKQPVWVFGQFVKKAKKKNFRIDPAAGAPFPARFKAMKLYSTPEIPVIFEKAPNSNKLHCEPQGSSRDSYSCEFTKKPKITNQGLSFQIKVEYCDVNGNNCEFDLSEGAGIYNCAATPAEIFKKEVKIPCRLKK